MTDFYSSPLYILFHLILWFGCAALLLLRLNQSAHGSSGLPLAYAFNLIAMHIGFLVYLDSTYQHRLDAYLNAYNFTSDTVMRGVEATSIGLVGFTFGALIATSRRLPVGKQFRGGSSPRIAIFTLIAVAAVAVLLPMVVRPPVALSAIFSAFRNSALTACAIGFAVYVFSRHYVQATRYLLLSLVLPIFYLLAWGFASYGLIFALTFLAFCLSCFRFNAGRIVMMMPVALIVIYLFATFFVGYMQNRKELRQVLWSDANLQERVAATAKVFRKLEFFDPSDISHLHTVNTRLNQNIFIGKAIENLENGRIEYANGKTLITAVFAWIPRFLWPGKPSTGGNELITSYTGLRFGKSTTMATGQIFELYINFGHFGVFLGMVLFGYVVRQFDLRCRVLLMDGSYAQFIRYHLAGTALILPSGLIFFMVTAVAAAWVAGIGLEKFIVRKSNMPVGNLRLRAA